MATSIPKDQKKLKELLDKLKAMAERGEKNERIVAQIKLEDLIRKYGILSHESKSNKRIIKVKDWLEHKNLLLQCIIDTKPDAKMEGYKAGKKIMVVLNDLEYILVCEKLEFYWKKYLHQKDALFIAFVVKNRIGIEGNDGEKVKEIRIDVKKAASFVNAMETNQFINKRQGRISK